MLEGTGQTGLPKTQAFLGHGCSAEGPSKPTEEYPTPGAGNQAGFLSPGVLLLHPTAQRRNMGLGKKRQRRDSPPPAAPSPQHPRLVAVPVSQDTARSEGLTGRRVWGCPGRSGPQHLQRGHSGGSQQQPRCASPTPRCPGFPEGQRAAGSWEGKHKPPGMAATPMPIQGSPQTEGTVRSQLPCCGAMAPQPAPPCPGLSPAGGPPRPLTAHRPDAALGTRGCLSLTPGCRRAQPASPRGRSALQPGWERGSSYSPGS